MVAACVVMLVCLGTPQAWSTFITALREDYGFTSMQMQLIFNTSTVFFCVMLIVGGRLHDRLGPRPMAVASAVTLACAWWLGAMKGSSYGWLWLSMGVLHGTGSATWMPFLPSSRTRSAPSSCRCRG